MLDQWNVARSVHVVVRDALGTTSAPVLRSVTRIDSIRPHHENTAVDLFRLTQVAHREVQPRNPDARVDVLRIRGRDCAELIERFRVRAATREPLGVGFGIG